MAESHTVPKWLENLLHNIGRDPGTNNMTVSDGMSNNAGSMHLLGLSRNDAVNTNKEDI